MDFLSSSGGSIKAAGLKAIQTGFTLMAGILFLGIGKWHSRHTGTRLRLLCGNPSIAIQEYGTFHCSGDDNVCDVGELRTEKAARYCPLGTCILQLFLLINRSVKRPYCCGNP